MSNDPNVLRERLATELHRIAYDIVNLKLPVADLMSARLSVGVLDSRADLERWADHLGVEIEEDGGTSGDIPRIEHVTLFDGERWGPSFSVHAQIQPDGGAATEDGTR
ncbi:hypothetical protein O7598_31190 [Micromonospora sp. WMMC241]|uniref:hypothetical protein n=1 Tax=Micromonospora sp. WMMC241 TaxID=3015159 RepID=UPI0022B5F827|nr:hypothetical protein [Micromonospora sp. WMMC241]MCZ7434799.1 hypothetical protein [Micromonospora sp. WMMC241]MCZ7440854.1 hypothetical protein [Micromonospora sp. WMMC241]MCZ7440891.1 hypothetical protein [Micromonospora sp. WMMC241]